MTGSVRRYRGLRGDTIRVPAESFATLPELHTEAGRYPFARRAAALGPLRDRFALAVSRGGFFAEALARRDVRSLLAQ